MKWLKRLLAVFFVLGLLGVAALVGVYYWVAPTLPSVDSLKTVQLQTPMRILSADGKLMSQFGEKRRIPLTFEQVPQTLKDAILATEDARFFEHYGIDPIGIMRAATVAITTGQKSQGASTITMQVARNFFLTREKTYIRKIREIFLAIHIEQLLTKQEIFELYVNRIFLGNRAYGVGAAAQVYYGREIAQLTLPEMAMIAGLPKSPSTANPIRSPERAKDRRNWVLGRMLLEGHISQEAHDDAINAPITARLNSANIEIYAPYIAEMARDYIVNKYGEEVAYTSGFEVYTTVHSSDQIHAQNALTDNLFAYDIRHGYRGPVGQLWKDASQAWSQDKIVAHLSKQASYRQLTPAVVLSVEDKSAEVMTDNGETLALSWDGLKWARPFISDLRQGASPKKATQIIKPGAQIWIRQQGEIWWLAQIPEVASAFVALDPHNGAIKALVGGYDFGRSQYNRVTQAKRQIGSNIKPFLYATALEKNYTLATLINNAPITQWDRSQGTAWRPKNSPDVYTGPTRFRQGLAQSINVMAVRILRDVGIDTFIDDAAKFGFNRDDFPANESVSLGSASVTPLENARAYAVFANGGFLVEPYFIDRIEDPFGNLVEKTNPTLACDPCQELNADGQPINQAARVICKQNAFLISEAMKSVIWGGGSHAAGTGWSGTAWRAARLLKRHDIGGKTGTTNEAKDTWFSGFAPNLVATAWVGFDNYSRQLGKAAWDNTAGNTQISGGESGAKTAGPIWNQFMFSMLKDVPQQQTVVPRDVVRVRIDRASGKLSRTNDASSRLEYFIKGSEPTEWATIGTNSNGVTEEQQAVDDLF